MKNNKEECIVIRKKSNTFQKCEHIFLEMWFFETANSAVSTIFILFVRIIYNTFRKAIQREVRRIDKLF